MPRKGTSTGQAHTFGVKSSSSLRRFAEWRKKDFMRDISLRELLEAGCHFGHQVTRQNPKAREFIYQEREGIHIIDLAKTREGLLFGGQFVHDVAAKGGSIVFVGTKRQAKGIVAELVKKIQETSGLPKSPDGVATGQVFLVSERWIGGTLTNFEEVAKNYQKLKDLRGRLANPEERAKYTKKEVGLWDKERIKLEKLYGGLCDMAKLPDALFIIDTHKEDLAVKEANRRSIPVVGIVDTNADPSAIDYPIPANDDAVGSVALITAFIADSWMEGAKMARSEEQRAKEKVEKEKVEKASKVPEVSKGETSSKTKKEEKDGKAKPGTSKKAA